MGSAPAPWRPAPWPGRLFARVAADGAIVGAFCRPREDDMASGVKTGDVGAARGDAAITTAVRFPIHHGQHYGQRHGAPPLTAS